MEERREPNESQRHRCSNCGQTFSSEKQLQQHAQECAGKEKK